MLQETCNVTTTNKLMQMVKVIMATADLRPRINEKSCGGLSHAIILYLAISDT